MILSWKSNGIAYSLSLQNIQNLSISSSPPESLPLPNPVLQHDAFSLTSHDSAVDLLPLAKHFKILLSRRSIIHRIAVMFSQVIFNSYLNDNSENFENMYGENCMNYSLSTRYNAADIITAFRNKFITINTNILSINHLLVDSGSAYNVLYNSLYDEISFNSFAKVIVISGSIHDCLAVCIWSHIINSSLKWTVVHYIENLQEEALIDLNFINNQKFKNVIEDLKKISVTGENCAVDIIEKFICTYNVHFPLTSFGFFQYTGHLTPETVLITHGKAFDLVSKSLSENTRVYAGVLNIRIFQPWSCKHFNEALPSSCNRVIFFGDESCDIYKLVATSLSQRKNWMGEICSAKFGPSVLDFCVSSVSQFLKTSSFLRFNTLTASRNEAQYKSFDELAVWSLTTSIPDIISEYMNRNFTSKFHKRQFDDVKLGVVSTFINEVGSLFSPSPNFCVISDCLIFNSFNVAKTVRHGGVMIVNTSIQHVSDSIPSYVAAELKSRGIKLYVIDADKIARDYVIFQGIFEEFKNLILVAALFSFIDFEGFYSWLKDTLPPSTTENRLKVSCLNDVGQKLELVQFDSIDYDQHIDLPGCIEPDSRLTNLGLHNENFPKVSESYIESRAVEIYHPSIRYLFKDSYCFSFKRAENEKTYVLTVREHVRLTPEDYERNVFHIDFDLGDSGLSYEIGEALAVYPQNDESTVQKFLGWYGADSMQLVEIPREDGTLEILTVGQLFTTHLDIFGKPGKKFFQSIAPFATASNQCKIIELLQSETRMQALWEETVTYADILELFEIRFSLPQFVYFVPRIKPRLYSISSSMKVHPKSVHLLIVLVDWETPSKKTRLGLCTRYLSKLKAGDKVAVSLKPSVMKLPSFELPVVMAGLGTGMAPFKAFVEERWYLKQHGYKVGPMILYFGARYKASEYLYAEDLEAYSDEGIVKIRTAFSRDSSKKVYIQHKIMEDEAELLQLLVKRNGSFYMCGPVWPVPDVKDALIQGFMSGGSTKLSAESVLERMKEEERFVLEVY